MIPLSNFLLSTLKYLQTYRNLKTLCVWRFARKFEKKILLCGTIESYAHFKKNFFCNPFVPMPMHFSSSMISLHYPQCKLMIDSFWKFSYSSEDYGNLKMRGRGGGCRCFSFWGCRLKILILIPIQVRYIFSTQIQVYFIRIGNIKTTANKNILSISWKQVF